MTYNVAIALACHIDPSNFNLDMIQCEERRRCWAGLMMLYTIQSIMMGNPNPTFRTSSSVKLPADVNDQDITLLEIQDPLPGPTQISYLLFKFSLYDLTSQICRETFSSSEPSRSVIQKLDQQICLAQETWDSRYISDSTFKTLPTHHAVHLHILHAYAHQLFLGSSCFIALSLRGASSVSRSRTSHRSGALRPQKRCSIFTKLCQQHPTLDRICGIRMGWGASMLSKPRLYWPLRC